MATPLNASDRFALINENLAEVLNPELIESILAEGRNPKIYWGTRTPRPVPSSSPAGWAPRRRDGRRG